MKSSKDFKSSTSIVKIRGGDRGTDVVKSMEIEEATKAILSFGEKASDGTTLAYQLYSYQEHPDYMRTIQCCATKPNSVRVLKESMSKILLSELIGL